MIVKIQFKEKIMQVEIIEFDTGINKKGEPYYQATVMGKFNSFGKIKTSTVEVNLTVEQYEILRKKEGQSVDLDFIIPKPSFPLLLSESQFGKDVKSQQKSN